MNFVYLASQSPRRRQLLEQMGVRYELLLPDADEDAELLEISLQNESPAMYVKRVTRLKLDAAAARLIRKKLPMAPILCSDTTVALGKIIYGKPNDSQDAERMLSELSGKRHRVITAIAIQQEQQRYEALSTSWVSFEKMSAAQITAYVATGESMGKAGAYAIQGKMAMHIDHISGSYSGIMGLALWETAGVLKAAGFES